MKDEVKAHENPRDGASVDPLVNALNEPSPTKPSADTGWRVVVAIVLLVALVALVYKQSF